MGIKESELILNPNGSIYHLNLKPENISDTILFVGDQDRVEKVTAHFDTIEFSTQKREFKTQTGTYKGKSITVISTGIGTDNIDIVFNELDALVNIDFETRSIKKNLTSLTIIRLGTSGAIQEDIPVGSLLLSERAVGFDNLLHFYKDTSILDETFSEVFIAHTNWSSRKSSPYVVSPDATLLKLFSSPEIIRGCTATNVGFYGPQGRKVRLPIEDPGFIKKIASFRYNGMRITNLEMETSGIYGLAKLLGHRAISLNAILVNRVNGTFSKNPEQVIENLTEYILPRI